MDNFGVVILEDLLLTPLVILMRDMNGRITEMLTIA